MTTFQCTRSGNLVSFDNVDDIEGLRKHEGYIEILPKVVDEIKSSTITKKTIKSKSDTPAFLMD